MTDGDIFPRIEHLDEVLVAIDGREEFFVHRNHELVWLRNVGGARNVLGGHPAWNRRLNDPAGA